MRDVPAALCTEKVALWLLPAGLLIAVPSVPFTMLSPVLTRLVRDIVAAPVAEVLTVAAVASPAGKKSLNTMLISELAGMVSGRVEVGPYTAEPIFIETICRVTC